MMIKMEFVIRIIRGITEYLANLFTIFRSDSKVSEKSDNEDIYFEYKNKEEHLKVKGSVEGKHLVDMLKEIKRDHDDSKSVT